MLAIEIESLLTYLKRITLLSLISLLLEQPDKLAALIRGQDLIEDLKCGIKIVILLLNLTLVGSNVHSTSDSSSQGLDIITQLPLLRR